MYYLAIQNRSFGVEFSFFFSKDARGNFDILKLAIAFLGMQFGGVNGI